MGIIIYGRGIQRWIAGNQNVSSVSGRIWRCNRKTTLKCSEKRAEFRLLINSSSFLAVSRFDEEMWQFLFYLHLASIVDVDTIHGWICLLHSSALIRQIAAISFSFIYRFDPKNDVQMCEDYVRSIWKMRILISVHNHFIPLLHRCVHFIQILNVTSAAPSWHVRHYLRPIAVSIRKRMRVHSCYCDMRLPLHFAVFGNIFSGNLLQIRLRPSFNNIIYYFENDLA